MSRGRGTQHRHNRPTGGRTTTPTRPDPLRRLYAALKRCVTRYEKSIVEYLAHQQDAFPQVWASRERIAEVAGCSTATVTRCVRRLEAAGVLAVERDDVHRRKDGTYGRNRVNRYRVLWPSTRGAASATGKGSSVSPESFSRAKEPRRRRHRTAPTPSRPVPLKLFEPEPPPEPEPTVDPEWKRLGITAAEWTKRMLEAGRARR